MPSIEKPIIVALDFSSAKESLECAKKLDPKLCRLKVGNTLFTQSGPEILEKLHDLGFDIFLDLKYHDIPMQVANACLAAAEHGVWMTNVHASGGKAMMESAVDAVKTSSNPNMILIAVTMLTSLDESDLKRLQIDLSKDQFVSHLAKTAQEAGLNGVVCSAKESARLRDERGDDFVLVTPGIRPANSATQDQKRVVTPLDAIKNGSHYLVIGRPITQAADPLLVLNEIANSLQAHAAEV